MTSNQKEGTALQCGLLALASARACNSAVISCAVAPVITPFKPASPFRTASNWASDMRFSSSMRRRTGLMCDTSGASMSVGSGIKAYRLKAGVLAHKSNIAPAIADYKSVCYSGCQVLQNTSDPAENRTRQSSGFFTSQVLGRVRKAVTPPALLDQGFEHAAHLHCFKTMLVDTQASSRSFAMDAISNSTSFDVTPFNFNSYAIRVVQRNNSTWFVCTDVAEALGYRNAPDASRHLDEDEKDTQNVRTPGGAQSLTIINESGLYALVLRSRKPEARKFAKWVTSEVLPAIRKTGHYASKTPTLLNRRWLVSYDHTGKEQVTEVPEDAFIMSFKQMLEYLNDPGVLIETEVLFEFCIKALERLKGRSVFLKQKNMKFPSAKEPGHV